MEFNNELFGATNEKIVLLDDLLLKIYIYCIKNEIDPAIVEVKVFTCRAFCPTGDFPVMRDAHRRGAPTSFPTSIFFQAEDGIRDRSPSRGLGDVYKRQQHYFFICCTKEFIIEFQPFFLVAII